MWQVPFSSQPQEADVADAADMINLEPIDHAGKPLIEHRHLITLERNVDRRAMLLEVAHRSY